MKEQGFNDYAMMTDSLNSQKLIAQHYNHYAGECATQQKKSKLLNILNEEHEMQFEIFKEMQKRGWYNPADAEQQKVSQACKQFQDKKKTL